jgi:hypothetical protein
MTGRFVLAMTLAPLVAGAVFGSWVYSGMQSNPSHPGLAQLILLMPGAIYGASFEVFVLLPLLWLIRRRGWPTRGSLIAGGAMAWTTIVFLNILATSDTGLSGWTLRDIAASFLPLVVPGVVLVLVFAWLVVPSR